MRPSGVAAIFRTTPPPEGILARANVSVLGSKRTMVFGFTPDSLYHTIPSGVIAIPYGFDSGPPGESYIFTAPVAVFSLPKWPLLKSVKYTVSSAAIASRRGRADSGSGYSVIFIVAGSIDAILLVPSSQKTGTLLLLTCIPYGKALSVGTSCKSILPLFGSSFPTILPP